MEARGRNPGWIAAGGTSTASIGAPKLVAGNGVMATMETERIASGSRFIQFDCGFTDF